MTYRACARYTVSRRIVRIRDVDRVIGEVIENARDRRRHMATDACRRPMMRVLRPLGGLAGMAALAADVRYGAGRRAFRLLDLVGGAGDVRRRMACEAGEIALAKALGL